jgi:hypothetical protein
MHKEKGNQIIPKTLTYKYTYLFILLFFSLIQILGFTNPTPLTEISSPRLVRKGIQKDWFVIQLLIYNWFKKIQSLIIFYSQ